MSLEPTWPHLQHQNQLYCIVGADRQSDAAGEKQGQLYGLFYLNDKFLTCHKVSKGGDAFIPLYNRLGEGQGLSCLSSPGWSPTPFSTGSSLFCCPSEEKDLLSWMLYLMRVRSVNSPAMTGKWWVCKTSFNCHHMAE